MKAALFDTTHRIRIVETDDPVVDSSTAVIRVRYAGICGTDPFIVSGKNPRTPPPLIPGHEFVGTIVKLPPTLRTDLKVGDRVTAFISIHCGACTQCRQGNFHMCENLAILGCQRNGAFAEYVDIPVENLIPVPDSLSDEQAVIIEPVSIAVHAVRLAQVQPGHVGLVVGAGPIGFLVASIARSHGCSPVIVLEVSKYRLDNAQKAGFSIFDARDENLTEFLSERTEGKGIDILFECAAQDSSLDLFMETGSPQSELIVVSNYKSPIEVDFFELARKEQRILTSRLSAIEDYHTAIALLESGVVDSELVTSHFISLDQIEKGLELTSSAKESMRVVCACS